jgi:SAM-dependent methyltransferase
MVSGRGALIGTFAFAILAGAALLLVAEPLAAKLMLPRLGGAPAVWNGCMLFFQAVLLAGYLYAHLLSRLATRTQVVVHTIVLAGAGIALPIALPAQADPAGHAPLLWLLTALARTVGLPFFALAATSPLLQRWFSTTDHRDAADPYFLYAAGNLGSLTGLLLYPFAIEPTLALSKQGVAWTAAFGVTALAIVASGVVMLRRPGAAKSADEPVRGATAGKDNLRERVRWIVLAAIPSSLVLGATQYISSDVAVVPLLWVVPLAAYLLSFVLAFAKRPWGSERAWGVALGVLAAGVALSFWALSRPYAWALLVLHPLLVLVAGVVCHRRLAALRPPPARLTEYFLCVAVGGVAGGIFNSILAPLLFPAIVEYPLAIVAACLARPAAPSTHEKRARLLDFALPALLAGLALLLERLVVSAAWTDNGRIVLVVAVLPCLLAMALVTRPLRFALALSALMAIGWSQGAEHGTLLARERTFFGLHRVIERSGPRFKTQDASGRELTFSIPFHFLYHGSTRHGMQAQDPNLRRVPTSYYHRSGPLGQIFAAFEGRSVIDRVAVIGAGAGTLAAYGEPGRSITFYEIDPAVERIARDGNLFTFVADSRGKIDYVLGDGRLELLKAPDGAYGLIVVDAFNSDAIPVHLITREALAGYLRKLRPDGLVAFHVTNQNLDLVPVLNALAADGGLAGLAQLSEIEAPEELMQGKDLSHWVVLARSSDALAPLRDDARWIRLPRNPGAPADPRYLWTDDYSSILSVLENW